MKSSMVEGELETFPVKEILLYDPPELICEASICLKTDSTNLLTSCSAARLINLL